MYQKSAFTSIWIIIICSIFISSCTWLPDEVWGNAHIIESENQDWVQQISNEEQVVENTDSEDIRSRIERIRKRHELRDLFVSAEAYLEWWQQALWLKTLLDVYRENPEDWVVVTKIAETYLEMKRFWSALNYYRRLPSLSERQQQRVILLHFYSQDLTSQNWVESLVEGLQNMRIPEQELRYYTISALCIPEPHLCKDRFNTYISSLETIESEKLNNMRLALRNYESFWLEEDYLLYTYIITEWYRQWLYPLVVHLWEKVMSDRSRYKPSIKLVWHSLFELWKYEEAKDVLTRFHRIDDSDPGINYMLGIIYAKTRDSVLANIFLRRALELWYNPTLNLRRHIAYNFALIDSRHNLLSSLKDLIKQEEDYEKTDLSLAIYYHILYESLETAVDFSQIWQERYPDDAYFYGYEWWALRELWETQQAIEVLQNWLQALPDNPFLYLQLAFALKENENIDSMVVVLDKLLELEIPEEYREIAERERSIITN